MTVPSSPEDRKRIKQCLTEMVDAMVRMDSERDLIKEIVDATSEKFEIDKKILRRLARTMHKANYIAEQTENEEFEMLYQTLVEGNTAAEAN